MKTSWGATMFRWPSLRAALIALRIGTAGLFLAHALVRIGNNTIPQFAAFMGSRGFPQPQAVVWGITLLEIVCSCLMMVGYKARHMTMGLQAIALGGIVIIHARLGWFVGEHGTGGSEYSVCLALCLVVISAADAEGWYEARP